MLKGGCGHEKLRRGGLDGGVQVSLTLTKRLDPYLAIVH